MMFNLNIAPCDDDIVFSLYKETEPFDKMTSLKEKARAVLSKVPKFPGSLT